jgi:peroxiredoxin
MKRCTLMLLALVALSCSREKAAPQGADGTTKKTATAETATAVEEGETLKIGSDLPAIQMQRLDGTTTNLAKLDNKVSLVNIWATWCGPCRVEIPELIAIHRDMQGQGVQVIGVSVDSEDASEDVKAFAREHEINYPLLLDPKGELAMKFDASVIPLSMLVDRKGKIVWVHYGVVEREDENFKKKLAEALAS